ncbi:ribose-5-phosphate isomerase [Clostridium sp. MT-14]|uniref:Ribose-5-phosphate isomerase n=1 Tax=Clostridium aromativorans TaxID=2836848 RepID=A0ABS8N1P5_9CLOT|nr:MULTISPECIES: ribose-5-phosphate isomerase [Clostridium]KAA8675927.1 ribose-5-phosphate isomerase [Clostridium sp. HV4-5-A1G]MCC9293685.1 ribose-5-phosphate isomerase [Clostridium aromativorans]CAB1254065.1 Ribose-5-phosphate isomerase [Clostridiaceae bacterium BL-3]
MRRYFNDKEKVYSKIIEILCKYKGLDRKKLLEILKDESCKYLFFLLVNKYECYDLDVLKKDFPSVNRNNMKNNIRKAEKKLLLNKRIRDMYFEAEELIDRVE